MTKQNNLSNTKLLLTKRLLVCLLLLTSVTGFASERSNAISPSKQTTFKHTTLAFHPAPTLQLSAQQKDAIGQQILKQIQHDDRLIRDPLSQDFLNTLSQRLITRNQLNSKRFHFFIFRAADINAFAAPSGIIGLNSGTFIAAHSTDEVASVLAHEMAHVLLAHIDQAIHAAKTDQFAVLAAVAAGLAVGGQAGQGLATAGIAGASQHSINFTRRHEAEADRLGMRLLQRAGFQPIAMPNFFRRLQTASQFDPDVPAFLRSHPVTSKRIADSLNRAATLPTPAAPAHDNFDLIQTRLIFLSHKTPWQLLSDYQLLAEKKQARVADRYGYALALVANGQLNKAEQCFTALLQTSKQNTRQSIFLYSRVEAMRTLHQAKPALALLKQHLALVEQSPALQRLLALALDDNGQAKQASHYFFKALKHYPNDSQLLFQLAHSLGKQSHYAEAYYYRAKAFLLLGDQQTAQQQLRIALKQSPLPGSLRANIHLLLKQQAAQARGTH